MRIYRPQATKPIPADATIDREREPFRLWKPTYKDAVGKIHRLAKWWIETKDHLAIVRRFPGLSEKAQSKALARQIVRLVACRMTGEQPGPDLTRWLERIPPKLLSRFAEIGLLDGSRAAGMKPLREHLADFRQSLLDKGDTPKQAREVTTRAGKVLDGCTFTFWSQIRADRVASYLAGLRESADGISAVYFELLPAGHEAVLPVDGAEPPCRRVPGDAPEGLERQSGPPARSRSVGGR